MDDLEKARRDSKRLKNALILVGLFIFLGILSGAPAYAYFICVPIAAVCGYFGMKD